MSHTKNEFETSRFWSILILFYISRDEWKWNKRCGLCIMRCIRALRCFMPVWMGIVRCQQLIHWENFPSWRVVGGKDGTDKVYHRKGIILRTPSQTPKLQFDFYFIYQIMQWKLNEYVPLWFIGRLFIDVFLTAQEGRFRNDELERVWKNVAIKFWGRIPKFMKE